MEEKQTQTYVWPSIEAPLAKEKEHSRHIHGDTVVDKFYWLNGYFKNTPDGDEVIDYLKAENNYADAMMAGTKDLQQSLFHELKGRIKEQDESVPYFKNGYYYYYKTTEGEQYYKYCRKKGSLEGPEELLLDVDQMAEGHAYFGVTGFNISPDNNFMVFGVDTLSRRRIYFIY